MGLELAIISGVASIAQGFQQKRAADAQASYYRQVAEQQRGQRDIARFQEKKRNLAYRSQQLAQIGKAGLDLTGTPLGLVQRTAEEQELDLLINDYNAELGVSDTLAQATFKEAEGQQALLGGFSQGAQTIYGGYKTYAKLNKGDE